VWFLIAADVRRDFAVERLLPSPGPLLNRLGREAQLTILFFSRDLRKPTVKILQRWSRPLPFLSFLPLIQDTVGFFKLLTVGFCSAGRGLIFGLSSMYPKGALTFRRTCSPPREADFESDHP